MKNTIIAIAIGTVSLFACNNQNAPATTTDSSTVNHTPADASMPKSSSPIGSILNHYLQLKNALAADDGKAAATAGNELAAELKEFDKTTLPADHVKTFEDIQSDATEHGEHIGANASNIKHQREHFETLSKDVYDLVKTFGAGQTVYLDFCPMYNNNKGGSWISEIKEISNPYMGKEMATCGAVKEELK